MVSNGTRGCHHHGNRNLESHFLLIKSSPGIHQLRFLNCILDLQTKQESWCLVARFKGQASGEGLGTKLIWRAVSLATVEGYSDTYPWLLGGRAAWSCNKCFTEVSSDQKLVCWGSKAEVELDTLWGKVWVAILDQRELVNVIIGCVHLVYKCIAAMSFLCVKFPTYVKSLGTYQWCAFIRI